MLKINPAIKGKPYYLCEEEESRTTHWPFVYLIGILLEEIGHDRVGLIGEDSTRIQEGIYKCSICGTRHDKCTLYFFTDKTSGLRIGFIALDTDQESLDYATEQYNNRL